MSSFLYLFKPLKLPAGSRPMISVSCLFKIRAPQGVCAEKERIGGLMEKQAQPAPGLLKTNLKDSDISNFSGNESSPFEIGMGWTFPYPIYNREIELIPGHRNPCMQLVPTSLTNEILHFENLLEKSFHCFFDWSKLDKTKTRINVRTHHLDCIARGWSKLKTTLFKGQFDVWNNPAIHVSKTLNNYGCGSGCASSGSAPDGYLIDRLGRLRGVMEVSSSVETPNSSLRKCVASAINIAYSLVDHGIQPWDVLVPMISSNGSLFQFGCVVLLFPCFPVVIPLTSALGIGLSTQRSYVAQYLHSIDQYLEMDLQDYQDKVTAVERGLCGATYHRKYLNTIFFAKPSFNQALFHLFDTLNKSYTACPQFIVYPLCVREKSNNDTDASLVFLNVCQLGYQVGVPENNQHQQLYIEELTRAVNLIHDSGFVHLDLIPSNILWKYNEQDRMKIVIINWDSIHEIGEIYDLTIQEILSTKRNNFNMNTLIASPDWDLAHLNILKNNLSSLISTEKATLDREFQRLWEEWSSSPDPEIDSRNMSDLTLKGETGETVEEKLG